MKYSTNEFIAAMTADSWKTMALELAENGRKQTGVVKLDNSDEFGEFNFKHPDYDDPIVITTTNETSTNGFLYVVTQTRLLSP